MNISLCRDVLEEAYAEAEKKGISLSRLIERALAIYLWERHLGRPDRRAEEKHALFG